MHHPSPGPLGRLHVQDQALGLAGQEQVHRGSVCSRQVGLTSRQGGCGLVLGCELVDTVAVAVVIALAVITRHLSAQLPLPSL